VRAINFDARIRAQRALRLRVPVDQHSRAAAASRGIGSEFRTLVRTVACFVNDGTLFAAAFCELGLQPADLLY
jgi:hypothetical protein